MKYTVQKVNQVTTEQGFHYVFTDEQWDQATRLSSNLLDEKGCEQCIVFLRNYFDLDLVVARILFEASMFAHNIEKPNFSKIH